MRPRRHSRPNCSCCGSPMVRVTVPTVDNVLARIPQWQWQKILANPSLLVVAQAAVSAGDVLTLLEVAETARLMA